MKKILFLTGCFLCLIANYSCSTDDSESQNISNDSFSNGPQLPPQPTTPPPTPPHGDDDQDKDKTKH